MADTTITCPEPSAEELEEYRQTLRAWLAENMPKIPEGVRYNPIDDDDDRASRARMLQRKLFDGGYAGICYPKEYGGQGLHPMHQRVFDEESVGYELPMIFSTPTMSITGPTVLDFGTEEQKLRYIPKWLSGEELWVQFMSEPSGGSDMAGALTRATRDGDVYLLNGSKIWSTYAYRSDYALALVRTNWDVPKHRGLSVLIVPIHQKGIEIQQIKMVDGSVEFCQEYFDDAVIPVENRLGEENDGWTVASRLLFHERAAVGGSSPFTSGRHAGGGETARDELVQVARRNGKDKDPRARRLLGEAEIMTVVHEQLVDRLQQGLKTGYFPGPSGSIARLYGGLTALQRAHIGLELAGDDAVAWDEDEGQDGHYGIQYVRRQAACMGGGTTEMARNIISERVLGMPREYAADRDVPFSEVKH